jgi:phage tail protein X
MFVFGYPFYPSLTYLIGYNLLKTLNICYTFRMQTYNASQGDMWDNLAYRIYGDEGLVSLLLYANPTLNKIIIFEKTTLINVPNRPIIVQTNQNLPPWKR